MVAQEVRKLAERSSESTEEIRQLITEIQAETNSTIMGIEDSTKWVAKGVEMIKETLDWLDRYLGPVATGPPGS